MSQLLQNHSGLAALVVLLALAGAFVVLARLAFAWARERAQRMEDLQRSLDEVREVRLLADGARRTNP